VLFIGAPVDAVQGEGLSYQTKFERTGKNTGNLLIGCGLRREIAYTSYKYGTSQNMETINQDFDLIAIPAANFIFKGFDFGYLADFIEATTLPCLIVGLGAQLPSIDTQEIDIPEGTKRFLKIVSERTVKIGVRGEFTAQVLAKMGIHNVTITGCPSLYWSLNPHVSIRKKDYSPYMRVSINGSRNVTGHSFSEEAAKKTESDLLKLSLQNKYDYVLQNEFPEIDILFTEGEISEAQRNDLVTLSKRFDLNLTPEHYTAYIRNFCKAFFSMEEWAEYIRTKDFSIGTRFHGNMVALQNGVPAVIIAHDSRTTEMARFMKIPHYPVDQCDLSNLEKIYNEADFEAFASNYSRIYENYYNFLQENKVPNHLKDPISTSEAVA